MLNVRVISVVLFALVTLGCGDSATDTPTAVADSSPPDTGSTAIDSAVDSVADTATPADAIADTPSDAAGQEKLICDALASRSACAGGAVECTADVKCIYGKLLLSAAASVYASCRSAPSCKSDDNCVAEAGKSVGGAAADKYTTDCVARLMACAGSFKDDFCSPALFAYAGAGASAQACMAKPCDQISACLGEIAAIKAIAACK